MSDLTDAFGPPVGEYQGIPIYCVVGGPPFAIMSKINIGLQSEAWHLGIWDGHKFRVEIADADHLKRRKGVSLND